MHSKRKTDPRRRVHQKYVFKKDLSNKRQFTNKKILSKVI